VISAGSTSMEQAGSGFAIAGRIRVAKDGLAIFAVTPNLEVHEGGRVVFGRIASFAVLGGIAALVTALVVLVRGRRRVP
jgi:hypothetical protein